MHGAQVLYFARVIFWKSSIALMPPDTRPGHGRTDDGRNKELWALVLPVHVRIFSMVNGSWLMAEGAGPGSQSKSPIRAIGPGSQSMPHAISHRSWALSHEPWAWSHGPSSRTMNHWPWIERLINRIMFMDTSINTSMNDQFFRIT